MTVSAGTWSEPAKNLSVSYRWSYDGKILSSHVDGSTYTPGWGSVHHTISVRVTVTAPGYSPVRITVTSSRLLRPEPEETWPPRVTGTAKAGSVLTAVPRVWTKDAALKYQWLRNGVPIVNATAATFKVRTADKGAKISVRATLAGYDTASWESTAVTAS